MRVRICFESKRVQPLHKRMPKLGAKQAQTFRATTETLAIFAITICPSLGTPDLSRCGNLLRNRAWREFPQFERSCRS